MTAFTAASRTTALAMVTTVALNLAVLAIGALAGADLEVAQSAGEAPMDIGAGMVVVMSLGPLLLGGLVLWLAGSRGRGAWNAVGWLGLALGIITVVMPIGAVATTGTTVTLASMHVIAGVLWVLAVRRERLAGHETGARETDDADAIVSPERSKQP